MAATHCITNFEREAYAYRRGLFIWRCLMTVLCAVLYTHYGLGYECVGVLSLPFLQHFMTVTLTRLLDYDPHLQLPLYGLLCTGVNEQQIHIFVNDHWAPVFTQLCSRSDNFKQYSLERKSIGVIRELYRQWRRTRLKTMVVYW